MSAFMALYRLIAFAVTVGIISAVVAIGIAVALVAVLLAVACGLAWLSVRAAHRTWWSSHRSRTGSARSVAPRAGGG
jgi:hypothetical protein